jgi:glycosyltransferase involved in cell wall biosynthesis
MDRLHVVFDARSVTPHFPGIGRYGSGMTQALAGRDDVRLTLLVDPRIWDTFYALPDFPSVERAAAPYSPSGPRQQWAIPALLRRAAVDVYHSPYYMMPYWPGRPAVVTLHDLIPLRVPGSHSAPFRWIYRWMHHLAARAARRIIAPSQATAADLVELGLARDKIVVVVEGVGPEFAPRPAAEVAAVRARYRLPDTFALYVGTNKPHKNLARLIEAWAGLQPAWPLVVAGAEDPRQPGAQEMGVRYGVPVAALGSVSNTDLPALYTASSLCILPSLYEGFGLPVIEAMACGAPVLCSNTSSLPEIVGDAALLFDPRDVEQIRTAVARAIGDPDLRRELSARGRVTAAQYTWARAAEQTVQVYRAAMD